MPHHPNLTVELTAQDLERVRALAKSLDLTIIGGPRSGDGSPRRLLLALAASVKANGLKHTAEAIKPLLTEEA